MVERFGAARWRGATPGAGRLKALIFGTTGQVARELAIRCPTDIRFDALSREEADLTDPAACAEVVRGTDADVIINAAAYTAVDRAEAEEAQAIRINGEAPMAIARAAAGRNLPFVHLSTDYVFDGTGQTPFRPDNSPAPINAYGRSKLAGEMGVVEAGGRYAILRTSWVFSAHGSNFVKTMLSLSGTNNRLDIVRDQIGGPTAAADIADAVWQIAQSLESDERAGGVYHFAGAPDVGWDGFAREVFRQADRRVTINPILSINYPTPARRPLNSRMDCRITEATFGIVRPDWRRSLADVLDTLGKDSM